MKVSVIIPVYNMAKSICECVNSILKQTYRNIEIILIDDGSNDNSFELCRKLARENEIVRAFHTANRGAGPSRNFGIAKATGDFAYFPDADDYLTPRAIEIMVNVVIENQCDLVVFGYRCVDAEGKVVEEKQYPNICVKGEDVRLKYQNYCNMSRQYGIQGAPWNKFFNLRIIKESRLEYPSLRRHQDEVFIARYVSHSEKICFINNVLYTYYKNDLKREWTKYPISYIDNVEQLRNYKRDIIVKWNPENKIMLDCIETEYICNYIKAMKLSFNKKFEFTFKSRIKWIIEKIQRQDFYDSINITNMAKSYKYQRKVIELIKKQKYIKLYLLLYAKVLFKQNFNLSIKH